MITYLFLALLFAIIVWRILPSMKLSNAYVAPAATGTPPSISESVRKWMTKYLLTIFLILVGMMILFFGLYSPSFKNPSLVEISAWAQARWFWIIILAGILSALIALNAKALGKAVGVLQTILWVVVAIFLVGFPTVEWLASSSDNISGKSRRQTILPQNAPNLPWAWHMDPSKWPQIPVPPHGNSVRVPSIFGGHIVWGGSGFTVHVVYSDGHECILGGKTFCPDGDIVSGYAHNDGDVLVYASYAYARKDEK